MLSPTTHLFTVGSEVEVVPDMLLTGAFTHVNAVMFDWSIHKRIVPPGWEERNELLKQLKVKTMQKGGLDKRDHIYPLQGGMDAIGKVSKLLKHIHLDDESYGHAEQKPLPKCAEESVRP